MEDKDKTKEQLINELTELRRRVCELEASEVERKETEEALRESRQLQEKIFASLLDAVFILNAATLEIIDCNPAASEIFGYSRQEMLGRTTTFLHVDETRLEEFRRHLYPAIEEKGFLRHLQFRMKRKDGTVFPTEHSVMPLEDEQGKRIGWVSVIRDIYEHKRAEGALKESEEKYRLLVENANDAIFIAQDGVLKFPNPAILAITGYSAEELSKIPFVDLVHPEDRDMVLDRYERRLRGEKVPNLYSFRSINRSGEEVWNQITSVLITWEGRPATLNFVRDITQLRKLETQFQQAQKMEAIGTLAGGIAHDFNNLLMGIQGYASLMMLDIDPGHPHYERLKKIEGQVRSGAELTKQLLGFAMSGRNEVRPTNVNEMLEMTSSMFGRTKKEIKIHRKYQKDIWMVEVDQGQIDQVLLNLYVNAWQAMPGGGDFFIETENVTLDENYTRPYKVEPGNYVKLSITDTGVGMDEETQQRIFEPFFTTREMGRGIGLGLASAYGTIKSHAGIINVDSGKGKGTTFNIYLPASEKKVVKQKKVSDEVLKGTETILLVDDEEHIMDVGVQLLKTLEYKVLEARSGKEAIEVYKKNKDKIDMVILDMIMPVIGGSETYDIMKEINPDVKVLLSSGYSIDGQAAEIMKRGCDGFIQKPFNMKELSQKLREILDST